MSASSPPMYLMATLKLRPGKLADFCVVMDKIIPIMEQSGWLMAGGWTNMIGRLNVVVDIWRVTDPNAVAQGFAALMQKLEYPALAQGLAECVEDEVLQLMSRLPYDPGLV